MSDGRCEFRFQPSGNRCQKPIHPGEESHLWQLGVNESLAQQGMNVDHDPAKSLLKPLPPSEKAELQVSLLNEIGLTLTAMAKEQVAHREVFKCLSLQLQAIDNDLAAKWAARLAQIELRISHIGAQLTVFAQEKPRKAGKRKGKK